MASSQRRDHLIDTAIELFGAHGFHATGIDAIVARAGVSKKTLYRHFRSKEELILAALKKHDGQFRNGFMRQVEARVEARVDAGVDAGGATPRARLLAVFDVAEAWFRQNGFTGCMFINAIGEYSAVDTPIRNACKEFKAMMRGFIEQLCREIEAPDPAGLAEELALLLEGAIVTAQVSQERGRAARVAKAAAGALIDQALAGANSQTGAQ